MPLLSSEVFLKELLKKKAYINSSTLLIKAMSIASNIVKLSRSKLETSSFIIIYYYINLN